MRPLSELATIGLLSLTLAGAIGAAHDQRVPVVVELFTSEGCSSCPPADDLLARLAKEQPIPGVEIIALEEHVNYWDRLGWRDPFSSAAFTVRQQQYAQVFWKEQVYTPQMVVDGSAEFIGSDDRRARAAIIEAAGAGKATVRIRVAPGAEAGQAPLSIRIENLPPVSAGDMAEALLAVVEDNLSSNVSRGENAGRKLSHRAVVRQLGIIGRINPRIPVFSAETVVKIEKGWRRENLRAVVFVQERAGRRVLGAATVALFATTP